MFLNLKRFPWDFHRKKNCNRGWQWRMNLSVEKKILISGLFRRFGLSRFWFNKESQRLFTSIQFHESTEGYKLNVFRNNFSNSSRNQRLRFWRKTFSPCSKETWVRKPISFHPYRKRIHHFFGLSEVSRKERKECLLPITYFKSGNLLMPTSAEEMKP